MKNKFFLLIFYILFVLNSNLLSSENDKILKVGLLAPLSGPYSEIGNSLLYSLQLALEEIDDKNVIIIPRDSGFDNNEKLNMAIKDMESMGVKIIIGPTTYEQFDQVKKFTYSPNPEILTREIEILTNYTQRKRNLNLRKKMFEDKEDEQSKKELERLDQLYTLGNVNFDSVIIIDFGNNLKSVLTSLVYTDVDQENVLFTTINQWFDESIFYENTIKNLYYPSVNYNEFKKYNNKYFDKFRIYPSEITILAYDALGLIYYAWKKNGEIKSVNDFLFKNKIKGKIGTFSFKNGKVTQELNIYKTENNKFVKF